MDDIVLPLRIGLNLCMENGFTDGWNNGTEGKKVPEARNGLVLCFEGITQTLSFFSFRIYSLPKDALTCHWKEGTRTTDIFMKMKLSVSTSSMTYSHLRQVAYPF